MEAEKVEESQENNNNNCDNNSISDNEIETDGPTVTNCQSRTYLK